MEKTPSSSFGLAVRVDLCLAPGSLLWLEKPCICLSTGNITLLFLSQTSHLVLKFIRVGKKDTISESTCGATRRREALGHPVLISKESSGQIGSSPASRCWNTGTDCLLGDKLMITNPGSFKQID